MLNSPQLEMERDDLDSLPPVELPAGYRIRPYRGGDEISLARVYAACDLGIEDEEGVRRSMLEDPFFRPERVLVLEDDSGVAGSASAWLQADESEIGLLHMVGVHPDHRGKGLGSALVLATLHQTHAEGLPVQRLTTDEDRLPALRTYLDLGYVPLYAHPSDPARWRIVLRALRRPEAGHAARARGSRSRAREWVWCGLLALRSLYHWLADAAR